MRRPGWRTLNAFVDGALDTAAAASVAEAAGSDPAIARQIAALYRLKGVSHRSFPAAPSDLGVTVFPQPRRRSRLALAVAVTLSTAAVIATLWLAIRPEPGLLPADLVATARSLHADWLDADASQPSDPPATLIAALAHFRQLPAVPDLESAKLTISRVRFAEHGGRPVLQVGYLGLHGCHLSLFVFAAADLPETMVQLDSGPERAYGWRVNQLGYMLFARGMDRTMLDLIAHTVERHTRSYAPFDTDTRQALADRKRRSSSCIA